MKSLNKFKMSFLSEWEQIMIDSLEDKSLELLGLIFETSNDLIRNEKVVKFKDVFYDYLGCPLPREGPDGNLPWKIIRFYTISVRRRGVI